MLGTREAQAVIVGGVMQKIGRNSPIRGSVRGR
jgi:hypothetical protein